MENKGEIIIYQSADGQQKIDVRLENETIWLTQEQMALLFQKAKSTINEHIQNIFEEKELDENKVMSKFGNSEFTTKPTNYYNLDVIISVGYRVKSQQGTQFRIWATEKLREYIVKGFVLNDDRFKSGKSMNYFDELLGRIREIRLSERMFYQKVKDIYKTSIDYQDSDEETVKFFKIIQNKLLWAISNQTAAELVSRRANAELPNMGMTSFTNSPKGKIKKADIDIAKNYLDENEMKTLGLLVEQYLAFAETQAMQQKPMYMKDWIKKLNDILTLNEREILEHAGKISHEQAAKKAETEYEKYKEKQKMIEKENSLKELEEDLKKLK
jgi:hypothetical protein